MRFHFLISLLLAVLFIACTAGGLRTQDSESRFSFSLDGWWNFRLDDNSEGLSQSWFSHPLSSSSSTSGKSTSGGTLNIVPVPASFNDLSTNASVRDYIGWFWYERSFYLPFPLLVRTHEENRERLREDNELPNRAEEDLVGEALQGSGVVNRQGRLEQISAPNAGPTYRYYLRFDSVHYYAKVWLNGVQVAEHESGHLPFEADVTEKLLPGTCTVY